LQVYHIQIKLCKIFQALQLFISGCNTASTSRIFKCNLHTTVREFSKQLPSFRAGVVKPISASGAYGTVYMAGGSYYHGSEVHDVLAFIFELASIRNRTAAIPWALVVKRSSLLSA